MSQRRIDNSLLFVARMRWELQSGRGGDSERSFGTWQGRLPQELRLRGITDVREANRFLRETYIAEFNARFTVPAAQKGSAFVRIRRKDLDWIFSVQHERTVNNDNTIQYANRIFQLDQTRWRNTLAGQTVVIHEHLDGRISIRYGGNLIAQYAPDELPVAAPSRRGTPRLPAAKPVQKQFGTRSFSKLEALPPDLRDLTQLSQDSMRSGRNRSAPESRILATYATPDISLAN